MRGAKKLIFVLASTISSLIFTNQAVFATDSLSVTLSSNQLAVSLMPGEFGTASTTITASTSSSLGYTIKLATSGATTDLTELSNPSLVIPTFTLNPGQTSIPASSVGDGYGISIDSGENFMPVPDPSTGGREIFSTNSGGQNTHTLTFGVKPAANTTGGSYANTFTIVVLANLACPADSICYSGNGDDGTGIMENQTASSNTEIMLRAPNYSRQDFGFAGWNTKADGTGTDYGPNETITTDDLSQAGLQLYAKWIRSSGNLQRWNGCDSLAQGAVIALTDTRDGNVYTVTKYPDGQCWTTENLRLNLSNPNLEITRANTNNPSPTFISTINNTHPASTNSFCTESNAVCINSLRHNTNNTNRSLTASYDANDTSSSWYSYGNYYNWYTITAGNGTFETSLSGVTVNGDICPSSWRLPGAYGNNGDFATLDRAIGGTGVNLPSGNANGPAASKRWRKYPLNFILGGEQKGNTAANRAFSSSYASQNALDGDHTVNLWLKADSVSMNSNQTYKYRGQTARCVYKGDYSIIGNIHYNANGGSGTMADETDVDYGTATAAVNNFTKSHAIFTGWNTKSDGSGISVAEGGLVTDAAKSLSLVDGDTLTLYAKWDIIYSLVYDGNGADEGSMTSVDVSPLPTGTQRLVAPNYSRSGYGFAGWSLDSDAATKYTSGQTVKIYGPNESFTVNNAFYTNNADSENQITFYAVWLPKDTTYTMQSFGTSECATLNNGDIIALEDERDHNTYTVAKLEDGKCWMIENLRLDPSVTTIDSTNTNSPTSDFISALQNATSSNILCNNNEDTCIDTVQFNTNNINRDLTASHNENVNNKSWYSYGVMYNWYTATAGNGTYSMASGSVTGDICPAGWRLPTGGSNGEYAGLNRASNNGSTNSNTGLLKFPDNFVRSGDYNNRIPGGRGTYARYWSATATDSVNAFRFGIANNNNLNLVTPTNNYNKWDAFTVRCVVK